MEEVVNKNMSEQFYTTGAKKDPEDRRDLRIAGITSETDTLPRKFILNDKYESKNQFSRGSCTNQAQAHHKQRQEKIRLSARFGMALTKQLEKNRIYGAYTRNSFKIPQKFGLCEESLFPEPNRGMSWYEYINTEKIPSECYSNALKHKSKSYWRVNRNIDAIKKVLITHGNSVVISMEWFKEFNDVPDGYLPLQFENSVGGHAVDVIGWDDEMAALIVKNSWGEKWGNNGNFYLPYLNFLLVVWDCWCSLDIPENPRVDNNYGQKRTWDSYLLEKSFAFNPWLINKIRRLPNNREIKGLAYGRWDMASVFLGKSGDIWLYNTKPEAREKKLINY